MFDTEAELVDLDQIRKARIILNKTKMERMLGRIQGAQPHSDNLLNMYLTYAKLDGKPEKGERKIADDFLLILDEVLAEHVLKSQDKEETSKIDIFRIGMLEHALSASPYNFDI